LETGNEKSHANGYRHEDKVVKRGYCKLPSSKIKRTHVSLLATVFFYCSTDNGRSESKKENPRAVESITISVFPWETWVKSREKYSFEC
jgi:hypothetical protein